MALHEAGHRVRVATGKGMAPVVAEAGLDLLPCGPDWVEHEPHKVLPGLPTDPYAAGQTILERLLFGAPVLGQVRDLDRAVRAQRPDALLGSLLAPAARLVARLHDLPLIELSTYANPPMEAFAAGLAKPWNALQDAVELSRRPLGQDVPHRLLVALRPSAWVLPGFVPPEPAVVVKPSAFLGQPHGDVRLPAGDSPLIVVAWGTVFGSLVQGLDRIVLALRKVLRCRVLVLGQGVRESHDPGLVYAGFVPLDAVLLHASLLLSHGGFGTVMEGLRTGVPQLVVPLGADHPVNAALVETHGCGILALTGRRDEMTPGGLPLVDLTALNAVHLAEQAEVVMGADTVRTQARAMAAMLADLPGPEAAVPLIARALEQSVAAKQP